MAAGFFQPTVCFQPLSYVPLPPAFFQPDYFAHDLQSEERTLVGKLLGKKRLLTMDDMAGIWELDGSVAVASLGDDFYRFSFQLHSDFIRAWSQGPVFGKGGCLMVRRWCPGLELDIKNMCCSQVWMQLPGLDPCYWTDEVLLMLASSAGQPITVDTSSSDGVRVCIEVDVNEPLVMGTRMDDGVGGFWQDFRYEIPGFCFHCGRLGHKREYCPQPHANINDYGTRNLVPGIQHGVTPLQYFSWRRPDSGWTKLNFDGSFKGRTGKAGAGGLLRDESGAFIACVAVSLDVSSSLMAEMRALECGLKLASELDVDRIVIEGDSKHTIEMLSGKREAKNEEQKSCIDRIHELLKGFQEAITRHEFREANSSADHLANMATQIRASKEWHHFPPHSLRPFLHHDKCSRVVPRLL